MLEELEGEIFRVPEYGNPNYWVTADEYLSGNVREKLKVAKQFAFEDSSYQKCRIFKESNSKKIFHLLK
ncbi:MAG: hypothetical protein L6V81_08295 [Clostridium sp.]|nr:MAG: hypothetical protein L6V81_08295 [Clostridium sp.]